MNLIDKAKKIRLLILDVDGVLTDGRVIYGDNGQEYKCFDVKDGHGLRLAKGAGLIIAFVSGRKSPTVEMRARDLGADVVMQEVHDKHQAYEAILKSFELKDEEVAYVADDIVDLPVLRRVGLSVAVADAVPQVKRACVWVTKKVGGRGAVREVVELILNAQGKWDEVTAKYHSA